MAGRSVDEYVAGFPDWRGDVLVRLRKLVHEAGPDAVEALKWGQPVWSANGPAIYAKAFANQVNLGFWRGADLDDPDGLLAGDGARMKHLRLSNGDALPEDAIRSFVRQAIELNATRGDPTKR